MDANAVTVVVTDFISALKWLVAGGCVIGVSWFTSWALEDWQWWHKRKEKTRWLLILLIALPIGALAQYILSLPPEALVALQPYGQMLFLSIGAWFSLQGFHFLDKKVRGEKDNGKDYRDIPNQ